MLSELQLKTSDIGDKQFAHGKGCETCNFTGFRGRAALAEIMTMDDQMKELVLAGASSTALQEAARASGMHTLREAGLQAIYDGLTTVEEVLRETFHGG